MDFDLDGLAEISAVELDEELRRMTMPFSNWSLEPAKAEGAIGYFARLVDNEGHDSMRVYSKWIEVNGRNIVPTSLLEVVCSLPISDEGRNNYEIQRKSFAQETCVFASGNISHHKTFKIAISPQAN